MAADNWLLDATHQPDGVHYPWTAGYFNLNSRNGSGGMAMPDLRDEGAAAVRYHAADGTEQDLELPGDAALRDYALQEATEGYTVLCV